MKYIGKTRKKIILKIDSFLYNELDIKALTLEISNKYENEINFSFKKDKLNADFDGNNFKKLGQLLQDISGLIPLQV